MVQARSQCFSSSRSLDAGQCSPDKDYWWQWLMCRQACAEVDHQRQSMTSAQVFETSVTNSLLLIRTNIHNPRNEDLPSQLSNLLTNSSFLDNSVTYSNHSNVSAENDTNLLSCTGNAYFSSCVITWHTQQLCQGTFPTALFFTWQKNIESERLVYFLVMKLV